tara:strand:+ start:862 stop:2532 length:1671 start_codon:yes stop_codon:yes gene_type:complete
MPLKLRNNQQSPLSVTELDANFTYLENRVSDGTSFGETAYWGTIPQNDPDGNPNPFGGTPSWVPNEMIKVTNTTPNAEQVTFNADILLANVNGRAHFLDASTIKGQGGYFSNSGLPGNEANTFFGLNAGGVYTGPELPDNLTAIGKDALMAKNQSSSNAGTGKGQESGDNTTAIGYQACKDETCGRDNTAIGMQALFSNTRGKKNVAIGRSALQSVNTTDAVTENTSQGESNIGIGSFAGANITIGRNNTIIGEIAGTTTLSNTLLIGTGNLTRIKIDEDGVAFNVFGGDNLVVRSLPVAGTSPGSILTWSAGSGTPPYNEFDPITGAATGYYEPGWRQDLTRQSVPLGTDWNQMLRWDNTNGYWETTNQLRTANDTISIIAGELRSPTGTTNDHNFKAGFEALGSIANDAGTDHDYNVGVGSKSLTNLITGEYNVGVGANAGTLSTGSNNTFIGGNAGSLIGAGSNNTFIGSNTGAAGTTDTVLISSGTTERIKVTTSGISVNTVDVIGLHGPILKTLTTVEIAALTTQVAGEIVFDSTLSQIKVWFGSAWVAVG